MQRCEQSKRGWGFARSVLRLLKQLGVEHAGSHGDDHHGETGLKMIAEQLAEHTHKSTSFLDLRRSSYYSFCTRKVKCFYARYTVLQKVW